MTIMKLEIHFDAELTDLQEMKMRGEILGYYESLERYLEKLIKNKDSIMVKLGSKINPISGTLANQYSIMAEVMLAKLPTVFVFERVFDWKTDYFIKIDVGAFQNIHFNPITKNNGLQAIEGIEREFKATIRRMRYLGKYKLTKSVIE